ncbi:hypothetical protein [Sphingobacterium sp.]|nr:hypothetical protein [Sphingobacterium sp.]
MNKERYIAPKIEIILIALENCFDQVSGANHNRDVKDKRQGRAVRSKL